MKTAQYARAEARRMRDCGVITNDELREAFKMAETDAQAAIRFLRSLGSASGYAR